jgi:threonine/homoserine/homoserine lactone efflux protein
MIETILIGAGFGFAAAAQPGPMQAYFLASVARIGWKRTLPAALAPFFSDGPIILLVLFLLNSLPEGWTRWLQGAGGIFLIYLGWMSYLQYRKPPKEGTESEKPPRTLLQAVVVNLLNPAPYLGWSLVLGPLLLEAWGESPANGIALLAAFYGVLTIGNLGIILLLGTTQFLSPEMRRRLVLVSAVVLGLIGVYQVGASVLSL